MDSAIWTKVEIIILIGCQLFCPKLNTGVRVLCLFVFRRFFLLVITGKSYMFDMTSARYLDRFSFVLYSCTLAACSVVIGYIMVYALFLLALL